MKRDFTFIDDIVNGIYGAIKLKKKFFHKVYNLGNNKPELLSNFIDLIELNLKLKAKKNFFLFNLEMFLLLLLTFLKVKKI